jgi:hypothetical protein
MRIASAVVNVAEPVYRANQENTGSPENPTVTTAFSEAKSELTKQAREAGINQIIRGALLLIIGLTVFGFHWRRAEAPFKVADAKAAPLLPQEPQVAALPAD